MKAVGDYRDYYLKLQGFSDANYVVKVTPLAAQDTVAPTVSAFSPADNATGVAISSSIVVTFNEAIQRGTGSIVLKNDMGTLIETFNAATSASLSISGSTLTINPTVDLSNSTAYKVEFAAGTIKDIAGNNYVGTTAYNFTTEAIVKTGKTLVGTSGNDTLNGSSGNDTFDGGSGIDTAMFSGTRGSHSLTKTLTGWAVSSTTDGTDTLSNIERLQFSDKTIAFDLDDAAGQVYRLYQAALDRVPDQTGLGDWIKGVDGGLSLHEVATGFINSAEFKSLYGSNPTNEQFVTLLYDNVLHRVPDTAGFNDWMNALANGVSKEDLLIGFSDSTENKLSLMAFDMDGHMGQVYRLYQAALDRTPDGVGVANWTRGMDNGMPLTQVATGFIDSAEFKNLYGNNPTNEQFVTLLYDNVLHRAPDTAGYNNWMNGMANGVSKEQALIGFSESLENQLSLVGIVQNGIEYV